MKKIQFLSLFAAAIMLVSISCDQKNGSTGNDLTMASYKDSVSYAFGLEIGENFSKSKMPVNTLALLKGFDKALLKEDIGFSPEVIRMAMMKYQKDIYAKSMEQEKKAEGEAAPAVPAAPETLLFDNEGEFATNIDTVSYVIGANIASDLSSKGMEINSKILVQALRLSISGQEVAINAETKKKIMMDIQERMFAKTKKEGQDFLAKNKERAEVIEIESGLQYEVLKEGNGKSPIATDKVEVHYHGTFIDGTVFDSSVDRGTPASFPLDGVIKGWTEGLQLMKTGAKYKFYIPSDLAYGDGPTRSIPGGSTLIFEVELLSIVK